MKKKNLSKKLKIKKVKVSTLEDRMAATVATVQHGYNSQMSNSLGGAFSLDGGI